MNNYAFLLLIVTGFIFLYSRVSFLGLLFFIIAFCLVIYNPTKKITKETWDEFSNAKGNDLTDTMKDYVKNATDIGLNTVFAKPKTKFELTSPKQIQRGSKNFFSELKKIFK